MTAPLPTIPRSSLFLPATSPVFLSAAPADELVATQLRADLQQRGVLFSNEIAGDLSQQEDAMHQAIRAADLVVVVGTSQMRSSRLVKEQLRIAQMYQRRLVLLWVQGDDLSSMLQDSLWAQLLPVEVIDARGTCYPAAREELLACLRQNPLVSSLGEAT